LLLGAFFVRGNHQNTKLREAAMMLAYSASPAASRFQSSVFRIPWRIVQNTGFSALAKNRHH